jgi:hypothetical protein
MAQGTANPGRLYGSGSVRPRALVAALAAAGAVGLATLAMTGTTGTGDGATPAVSSAAITPVDDFVTRRYLSSPAPADDSWKDDHITRRYLPGD